MDNDNQDDNVEFDYNNLYFEKENMQDADNINERVVRNDLTNDSNCSSQQFTLSKAPKIQKKRKEKRSTVNELALANKSRELKVDNDIHLMQRNNSTALSA